jgi:putative transposase
MIGTKFMDQQLPYIHQNLVKEGWEEAEQHYLYGSARHYSGLNGLVPVELIRLAFCNTPIRRSAFPGIA